MTSFVELEQTCDWNVNLSCWWSSSELSNTELHRKHISRNGPGSIFTDFMTTAFSSWNSKACHGRFVGNPRYWSSWDWSATTPWGSISPSPSSRWKQSLKKITLKKIASRWARARRPHFGLCTTIPQYLGTPRTGLSSCPLSSTATSPSRFFTVSSLKIFLTSFLGAGR